MFAVRWPPASRAGPSDIEILSEQIMPRMIGYRASCKRHGSVKAGIY